MNVTATWQHRHLVIGDTLRFLHGVGIIRSVILCQKIRVKKWIGLGHGHVCKLRIKLLPRFVDYW